MSTELCPTHFVTCGGYSAFFCAPEAAAEELAAVASELRKMVDAAVNAHGGRVIIPEARMHDLENARRPDIYFGCYVVESEIKPGRFLATIIPTQGTTADAVAACERHFANHFTGCRLESLLTSVWWSEPIQRFYDSRFAVAALAQSPRAEDGGKLIFATLDAIGLAVEAGDCRALGRPDRAGLLAHEVYYCPASGGAVAMELHVTREQREDFEREQGVRLESDTLPNDLFNRLLEHSDAEHEIDAEAAWLKAAGEGAGKRTAKAR